MDPILYMQAQQMSAPKPKGPTRIPLALQEVFIASNSGQEVLEAPAGNVASKTFVTKNNKGKKSSSSYYKPKVSWLFKSKKKDSKKLRNDNTDASSSGNTKVTVVESDTLTNVPDKIKVKKIKEASKSRAQSKERSRSEQSPQDYLDKLLSSRGYSTRPIKTLKSGYYATPTQLQLASYHDHLIQLARTGRNDRLRETMECGISSNPCNRFGESLVHTVCRRCEPETLQTLLDAGTRLEVSDDFGRTPLHDACWRAEPCFELVELIASKDLYLFRMADCRGKLPLSYIPQKQWREWNRFLEYKKDVWWPQDKPAPQSSSTLARLAPNSQPIQDPENALKPEIAAMVSAGRLKPKEAVKLNRESDFFGLYDSLEEDTSDDDDEDSVSSVSDYSDYDDDDDSISVGEDDQSIIDFVASASRMMTM